MWHIVICTGEQYICVKEYIQVYELYLPHKFGLKTFTKGQEAITKPHHDIGSRNEWNNLHTRQHPVHYHHFYSASLYNQNGISNRFAEFPLSIRCLSP